MHRLQTACVDPTGPGSFAAWRQTTANVFDISADSSEIGSFEGTFVAYSSKQFILTEATSSRLRLKRSPETITRSRLDHFAIRLLINGSTAGFAGYRAVEAVAGDILFIDLSQTLDLQASLQSEQTSDVSLWIPRARILASFREENALHGLVVKGTSPAGAMIGANLLLLGKHTGNMTCIEMDALANGVLELTARAIASTLEKAGLSATASQLASFVTIRRYIDRNLTSTVLDANAIAKSFGLSRASLYRIFEPVGGIASYIRKARLNRAHQEVTSFEFSDRRIGQIAINLGFKNISAFNRLFHKVYGLSPREAREQATMATADMPQKMNPTSEIPLAGLLAQIGLS